VRHDPSPLRLLESPRVLFWVPTLIWASTWHVILYQLAEVPPLASVAWRFMLAGVVLLAVAAARSGGDVGGSELLTRYDALRRADVNGRALAVDLLNRTLLTDFLPVQGARGLGLYLLDRIGPLRRALMREGVAPRSAASHG